MRISLVVLLKVTVFLGVMLGTTLILQLHHGPSSESQDLTSTLDPKLVPNAFRPLVVHDFRRLLVPFSASAICSPAGQDLAIYVHSAPGHARKRERLRRTWGSQATLRKINATLVFVMGRVKDDDLMAFVQDESTLHGDILMEEFLDSYRNLTHKAVAGLKWISENCTKARYVLKTDDDILADVFHVSKLLKTEVEEKTGGLDAMACNYWTGATPVVRARGDKWYVPVKEFSGNTYGPFCQGSAFMLSADVAQALFQLTFTTPFFRLDDVYVTGFLLQQLNISVIPLNDLYITGGQSMRQFLKKSPHDSPLFFHELYPHNFFRAWYHMQNGTCCPLIR